MEARTCILIFLSVLAAIIGISRQQQCLKSADVVVIVDGSNSMGKENFERMKNSIINLVMALSVSDTEVHVGLTLFARKVDATISLTGNKTYLIEQIRALMYPDEDTRVDLGIDAAIKLFQDGGRTGDVARLMLILVDGHSTAPAETMTAAKAAKDMGITIFSIGITNSTDPEELEGWASSKNQVYYTDDFIMLEGALNNATNRACVDLQATMTTPLPPVSGCQNALLDIVFLVSMSDVEDNNFEKMKTFMKEFLYFADISNKAIRVGLVTYGNDVSVKFYLNTYSMKDALNDAITNIQYMPGNSNITEALKIIRMNVFTKSNGDRPEAPNVVILLSTNDENVNLAGVKAEAEATRGAGIQIYGISIGQKNSDLIDAIASRPLEDNRFMIDTFSNLTGLIHEVYDKFNRFCETPPPVPACYMGVSDIWFVVDASVTAENLSSIQSAGDFLGLKNGMINILDIIADPSVANPGIRLGFIAYSDTSYVVVNVTDPDTVIETGDAVMAFPGVIMQGGANLGAALANIVMPPVNSSYRNFVAIVAPESSFISNMNSLMNELPRLKDLGFTLVFFVISENKTLDRENLQNEASGPNFFYYISNYMNLEAATKNFTRDRLCNNRVKSGLCVNSGHIENGVGVVPHPMDCDKYIQCYYNASNDLDLGVVRNCPMGLHWNQTSMKCLMPSEATCPYDRCKEECDPYKMEGACGAYWECQNGMSTLMCCPTNYTFIPSMGCKMDSMCMDTCGQEKWCGMCQKKPNWEEPSGYDVMIMGGNMWLPRPCFYEDFDIVDCDCTASRDQVCPADRMYDFRDSDMLKSIGDGNKEGIRVSDVMNTTDGLTLGHKSAIHVSVNKPEGESGPFTVKFRYRETETFSPYGETLFSSGVDCGTGNSLLVSASDQYIFAEVRSMDGQMAEVKVPTKGLNMDEFKDLVLHYENGELALSIKDEQTQYIAKTKAPFNICFSCGLDFGQAMNKLSFDGEVQMIAVYSCAWHLLY